MKLFKPNKQTVLKGLLLLVVGLNFSWKPLITEIHQTSMAQSLPAGTAAATAHAAKAPAIEVTSGAARQKSGAQIAAEKAADSNDPFAKYAQYCGKYITLKATPDNARAQLIATDADKKVLKCKECEEAQITINGPIPMNLVEQVRDQLKISCESFMTDEERAKLEADKKAKEDEKLKVAQDEIKCLADKHGKDLDSNQKLSCQLRNMNLSDKKMKEAGFDTAEANDIRKALAKDSLSAIAKTCKKNHKEADSFDECEDLMARYDDSITRLSDSGNDSLKSAGKTLSDKYTKLYKFEVLEKKALARVEFFKTQYDGVNTLMQKAYDAYTTRCDSMGVAYGNSGRDFDTEACRTAYVKQYLLPRYEPILRQITSKFTAEENKFHRDFTAAARVDIIGKDGAANALAPFREYTKELATYGQAYNLPQRDLPVFADEAGLGTGIASALTGNDLAGRLGTLAGARQFTPLAAAAGSTTVGSTISPFAIPSVLSTGQSLYKGSLPLNNLRGRSAVTNGLVLPVQDASIVWN